jgi:hypothetical protein
VRDEDGAWVTPEAWFRAHASGATADCPVCRFVPQRDLAPDGTYGA